MGTSVSLCRAKSSARRSVTPPSARRPIWELLGRGSCHNSRTRDSSDDWNKAGVALVLGTSIGDACMGVSIIQSKSVCNM
jgi:hypothetical protein